MSTNNNQINQNISITISMTNDIQDILNKLNNLAEDHFCLDPDNISEAEVIELLKINKLITHALGKAERLSQDKHK